MPNPKLELMKVSKDQKASFISVLRIAAITAIAITVVAIEALLLLKTDYYTISYQYVHGQTERMHSTEYNDQYPRNASIHSSNEVPWVPNPK